jgi:hypothetical protein
MFGRDRSRRKLLGDRPLPVTPNGDLNAHDDGDILCRAGSHARGRALISTLTFTLRYALAAVLTVSAVAKLRSFDDFRWTVRAVVPRRRTASVLAGAVVAVEATLAVLLAAGLAADAVAAATFVLFLGFVVISVWAELRGLRVRCNCFGHSDRELGKDSLATSLPLAVVALVYWALLRGANPELALGELPLAACLGVAVLLGARWLLAGPELVRMTHQRRLIDKSERRDR